MKDISCQCEWYCKRRNESTHLGNCHSLKAIFHQLDNIGFKTTPVFNYKEKLPTS